MKKLVLLMMIVCMAIPCFGIAPYNIWTKPDADWLTGQTPNFDPAWAWMKWIDAMIEAGSTGAPIDTGGTVYYVDNNNGSDTNNGTSWAHPFLTITKALLTSHDNIRESGLGRYANRNRIYVKGDDFDEDWTDLAQKTDIIGVGSDDGNKGPRILGNHEIDAVEEARYYMGCRFINMTFVNQTAADIFTVPTGHHGIEWIGCTFESNSSTLAPSAIDVTACHDTRIVGCTFVSSVNMLWASGAIDFGAGSSQGTDILGNYIDAAIGITIEAGTTGRSCRIEGNTIHSSTLTIDDNADIFHISNNTLITDTTIGVTSFDFNQALANNNRITGSNGSEIIPALADHVGRSIYVDSANGSATNTGLSWAQAVATITQGLARMADYDTLYVGGVAYDEDCTTPVGIERGKIIGVCKNNQIPFWTSTVAGNSHLTISSGEWEVANFRFYGAAETAAYVVVTAAGSSSIIRDCWFSGNGCESGIEVTGPPTDLKILRNRFSGFTTTDALDGAICGTDYGIQAAVCYEIVDNMFGDNTQNINLLMLSCRVTGNSFTTTATSDATTIIISTSSNAPGAGAGGGNVIAGNYFPHLTYQIDAAHGYEASTYDNWVGNYCPDGLTTENVPGAGTANIEQDGIVPTVHLTTTVTANFSGAAYETGDSPVTIFTVTGDVLVRAFGVVKTACTSTGTNGTLELGVAGATAVLLVQDAVDGTAFDTGFTWTKTTACSDDNVALLDAEWILLGNGPDIILTIATNSMTAGIIQFGLQWIPMSANAEVVGAAP